MLRDVKQVTDEDEFIHNMLSYVLQARNAMRYAEAVKVMGLSNYHCKILSPLLTRYGMDKKTGKPQLLTQLNQAELFDCRVLGDRCFLIERENMELADYGRDTSGSDYLAETLGTVRLYNDNEERLLPLHADGDGHCLVHAVSRALVGRELFWHPLRTSLKIHMQANMDIYKELFREFIDQSEWQVIIDECSPEFEPPDGEILGLRNIHIFGLANVLGRPIILIDSLSGMQSPGDYSATFLPALASRSNCMGKDGELNKPLCIAWSSSGRNHYIPLVGIKNSPLPRLPRILVPKAWGLPQEQLNVYIEFDQNDFCIIGGDKCLQDNYILRLAAAMEEVFMSEFSVHPGLVADVQHHIFKRTGVVGAKVGDVLEFTQKAVREQRLYVCLKCSAIFELQCVPGTFKPGGAMYTLAEQHGHLRANKLNPFPLQGAGCSYNAQTDELVPSGQETVSEKCSWCSDFRIRRVNGDGSIQYQNGDCTKTRSTDKCGFKHFWNSVEYDHKPQMLPVAFEWSGKVIVESVPWFQNESDPKLNSNVYTVATNLVQKYFPGVFGSETMVQKVVQQLLEQTKKPEEEKDKLPGDDSGFDSTSNVNCPDKIILSGFGTIHKEELTLSETELSIRRRITENAPLQQNMRSSEKGKSVESSKIGCAPGVSPLTASSSPLARVSNPGNSSSPQFQPQASSPPTPVAKLERRASARMIRVVTTDGRQQFRMVLEDNMTHATFLKKLKQELHSSRIKRILYGFPPRELVTPLGGVANDSPLPFEAGDKVSVEIVAEPFTPEEDYFAMSSGVQALAGELAVLQNESDNQRKLLDLQNSNVENLDLMISAMIFAATYQKQDFWTYVQSQPHLFKAGGLFYLQVDRDIGLIENKHYSLPCLPDKRLSYNKQHDLLELCLDSLGHFVVVPGVEDFAALGGEPSSRHQTQNLQHRRRSSVGFIANSTDNGDGDNNDAGSASGVVISRSQQRLSSQVPFDGKGYSMTQPSLVGDSATASRSNLLSLLMQAGRSGSSGRRLEEEMETDHVIGQREVAHLSRPTEMVRRGPGYSVINAEVANQTNSYAECIKNLLEELGEDNVFDNSQEDDSPDSPIS